MLFIDDTRLPTNFRDDGMSLCKLWILTHYGELLSTELINNVDAVFDEKFEMESVSAYKINRYVPDIIKLDGKCFISDGVNRVVYSPFRNCEELERYNSGMLFIESKYSIRRKN